MLNLLVTLLILVLVFGLVWWVVSLIPLPAPFATVAQALVAVIFIIILLGVAFGGVSMPALRM